MSADFIDTNVLLYAFSADATKAARAQAVLAAGGVISVQVLNETASVARRKMRLDWAETAALLSTVRELLTVVPLTLESHRAGIGLCERYGLAIDDGMIIAAALDAGCDRLFTEDMQHTMRIDGRLVIENPFA